MSVAVTRQLAEFAVQTDFASLPSEVIFQAKRCFLDWLGVTLRGSREPLAGILHDHVALTGGAEQATILGKGLKTSVVNAALVNGAAAHAMDYDDLHWPSLVHPSAAVFAALLAACEWQGLGGKELLTGYVVGFDLEARLGTACGRRIHDGGRHVTANLAPFGVVAGAASILGLTPEQVVMAYGIAGTQAAGLVKSFGTMAKPLHPGKAAFNGLQAAMLARQGYTGAAEIFEGEGGVVQTLVGSVDLDGVVDNLGKSYEVMNNSFKAYAACGATHASIDAALTVRRQHAPDPRQIEKIICRVPTLLCTAAGKPDPKTGLEGKFSVQYCVAVALAEGGATEDKYVDEKVGSPLLKDLTHRVVLETDPSFRNNEAGITVRMRGGEEYTARVDCCTGTPTSPMSEDDFEAKFRTLAGVATSQEKCSRLIDLVWNLEKLDNLATLANLCW